MRIGRVQGAIPRDEARQRQHQEGHERQRDQGEWIDADHAQCREAQHLTDIEPRELPLVDVHENEAGQQEEHVHTTEAVPQDRQPGEEGQPHRRCHVLDVEGDHPEGCDAANAGQARDGSWSAGLQCHSSPLLYFR